MSAKRKTAEAPKPRGAPAYMGQYASLMTILLAFFIVMLTLGQDRVAQFKVGIGLIRNLIGLTGGAGVLDFWRSARRPPVPTVVKDEPDDPDARLIGYEHGTGHRYSLVAPGMARVDFEDARQSLRLRSSIRFEPGRLRVRRESRFALDHAAALLYSLQDYRVVVGVMEDTGDPVGDRHLAARRAAWLARHLVEQGRMPPERVRSMGLARTVESAAADGAPVEVIFLLRRMSERPAEVLPRISEKENEYG